MPVTSRQLEERLLNQASTYHRMGWFQGCARIAEGLLRKGSRIGHLRHLVACNRFFLRGPSRNGLLSELSKFSRLLDGGQHFPELAVLMHHEGRVGAFRQFTAYIVELIAEQQGRLKVFHPTPLLELTELALQNGLRSEAICFVNLLLAIPTYALHSDLGRLGKLLIDVSAPPVFWGDWSAHFIRHLQFALVRKKWQETDEGLEWACNEEGAAEHTLLQVLAIAPPELHRIIVLMAAFTEVPQFGSVVDQRFKPGGTEQRDEPDPAFTSELSIECRFPWFRYLTPSEQNFVTNGDWALVHSPTDDYSMGLAQWWRATEAVLKRAIILPLAKHLQSNPRWLERDLASLTEKKLESERIFIHRLAKSEECHKLTLADMELVLAKCQKGLKLGPNASQLRNEAVTYLAQYEPLSTSLVESAFLRPVKLRPEIINRFRNQASHDQPASIAEAAVGRTLASRLLTDYYLPSVRNKTWTFRMIAE